MADLNRTVVRTLNYLRGVHLPTYVALRLLLNRVPVEGVDSLVEAIINQATIRKTARVLNLKRFKSIVDGEYIYRHYSVPSPTSALADSYAISVIHDHRIVDRRSYVYSYRRPDDGGYPRNFEHFSVGYRDRNEAIASALADASLVAVIVDIRNFYPSVDVRKSINSLSRRLSAAPGVSDRDRSVVLACANRACLIRDGQPNGLRVGPEMSHVLADISLEDVDSSLSQQFGDRYFRYVDDIVVVVPKQDASTARETIGKVLEQAGHSISEEKDSIANFEDWMGYRAVASRLESVSASALNKFKFRAKLYMAKRPPDVDSLREGLRGAGVFLPVEQLLDASRQRAWRYRVSSLFSRNWSVVVSCWNDSLSDVVLAARQCKQHVIDEVDRALNGEIRALESSVARKWRIQDARMAINRALYFADEEALERIRNYTAGVPELAETSAVCRALLGDPSQVIKMPGPAVAAFSQVASIRGSRFPHLGKFVGDVEGDMLADVSAHFSLRGGGEEVALPGLGLDFEGLTAFARGASDIQRLAAVGGYGAEVAALAINSSQQDRVDAAATRFSLSEDLVLDALSLSANYVS